VGLIFRSGRQKNVTAIGAIIKQVHDARGALSSDKAEIQQFMDKNAVSVLFQPVNSGLDVDRMIDGVDIEKMSSNVTNNAGLQKHLETLIRETALDADAQKEIGVLVKEGTNHVARSQSAQSNNPKAKRRRAAENVLDFLYSLVYIEYGANVKPDKNRPLHIIAASICLFL